MKELGKYLLMALIGLLLGFLIFKSCSKPEEPEIQKPDITKELIQIDSLTCVIKDREKVISDLKDSIKNIKTVVVVKKVEVIKHLPLNENVELLKENLLTHGELTTPQDSLPSIITAPEDTIVALSENNVKDVNCIVAKYEGEIQTNEYLNKIVQEDSLVISAKDSIILNQDFIINEQNLVYNENIKRMTDNIRKQQREKAIWIGALGTVAAILTGILIAK